MAQYKAIESREFNSRTEKENLRGSGRAWFLLFPSETCSRLVDKYNSVVYSSQQLNHNEKKKKKKILRLKNKMAGEQVRDADGRYVSFWDAK